MLIKEIYEQFIVKCKIETIKRGVPYFDIGTKETAFLISEAQQDIQKRLDVIIGTYAISTVSGTKLYSCPEDFGKLKFGMIGDNPIEIDSEYNLLTNQPIDGNVSKMATYTAGNTPQILVYPTPTSIVTLNIYYSVDTNYYQPSNPADQVWGGFGGEAFVGKLLLPDKYNKAVLLYLLSQIYDDFETKYDKEILSLKGYQAAGSPLRLSYNFGTPRKRAYITSNTTNAGSEETETMSANRLYQVAIAQAGTAAPVISHTFFNTLSGTIGLGTPVFARTGVGVYTITFAGAFTSGKTFLFKPNIDIAAVGDEVNAELEYTSADIITLRVFDSVNDPTDGFNAIYIKIEVEP